MADDAQFILRKRTLLPAEDCLPDTLNKLLDILEDAIELINLDSGQTVNLGDTQPTPDDVDKPWIRTDLNGTPAGLYQFYNGLWRNMGPIVGMQVRYNGNLNNVLPPWYHANGSFGTQDLTAEPEVWIEFRGFA